MKIKRHNLNKKKYSGVIFVFKRVIKSNNGWIVSIFWLLKSMIKGG